MKRLIVTVTFLLSYACSSEDIYTALQQQARDNCSQYSGAAYQECLTRSEQSYKAYRSERDRSMSIEK